eukprot:5101785-Pyramimonas_sp.AAC.1
MKRNFKSGTACDLPGHDKAVDAPRRWPARASLSGCRDRRINPRALGEIRALDVPIATDGGER